MLQSRSAFVAAILLPCVAQAAELDSVVVTASRDARPLDQTGQSVSIISLDTLERLQSVTPVDVLQTVTGIALSRNGGIGGFTAVNIRGGESHHTAVLIDGVKVNDPSSPSGGFNFGNLITGNIERIEVVRGAQSVLWGSHAIGGVVNMITRAPGKERQLTARAEYGAFDSGELVGNLSGTLGPVAMSVGAGHYRTDGVSSFARQLGGTEPDGLSHTGVNARAIVTLSPAVSADLRGWYAHSRTEVDGFAPPFFNFGDTGDFDRTNEFVSYAGLNTALLDGRWRNRMAYAHTVIDRDSFAEGGAQPPMFAALGRTQRLEYQGIFQIADGWDLTAGAEREWSRSRTASFGGPADRQSARITSLYGQLTARPVAGITLTAGVRHDDHDRFGSATTAAASAVWALNEGSTLLRASWGEGFKAPTLYQLYSDYGNPGLEPESSHGWDAGITQKLLEGRAELAATWFQRRTTSQIDFGVCVANPFVDCAARPFGFYDNLQRTQARGLEVTLNLKPVDAMDVAVAYTLLDAENRVTGDALPRRARHTVSATVDYEWSFGLATGATLTHVGARWDDSFQTNRLASYTLVDLRASLPVAKGAELYARIENLFDVDYQTVFQYGARGRGVHAGIRLDY